MRTSRRSAHAVYFIGIGGIGMSALARYFLALRTNPSLKRKWLISGSDAVESPMTRMLRNEGVKVKIGHKRANIDSNIGLVIYNRAIPKNNPELLEAKRRKIPVVPYARVLGEITKGHTTIAITGSHGKTTTTALAGIVLMRNDFDPTIFVGSKLKELGNKNMRIGKSPYLVLEADDFGGAFTEYHPKIAIVTNIDREHLDFYKTFNNLKKAFLIFLSNVGDSGTIIVNRDDSNLYSLRPKITKIAEKEHLNVMWYSLNNPKRSIVVRRIKKILKISGEHNVSNALAVYHLGIALKISEKNILRALGSYRGAWRRMEYRGTFADRRIPVFDDYAHHPTEIKATLQAFREKFPHTPLICVFQPHQAKRLQALFKEFQGAFREADAVVILPIYAVQGRDDRTRRDSKMLVTAIKRRYPGKKAYYLADPKKLKLFLQSILGESFPRRSPVIIMMGAGDIVDFTDDFVTSK